MEYPDRDERVSWRAATIVMVAATVFTLISRIVGLDPFTLVFDFFIVYLTTGVLLIGLTIQWLRAFIRRATRSRTRDSPIVADSLGENKAA